MMYNKNYNYEVMPYGLRNAGATCHTTYLAFTSKYTLMI